MPVIGIIVFALGLWLTFSLPLEIYFQARLTPVNMYFLAAKP